MVKKHATVSVQSAELERERLISLINSMADGVLAIDDESKIVLSNGEALNLLDVNVSLNGKRLSEILHLIDSDNNPVNINKVIRDSKTIFSTREWRLAYPDDETINLYISISPVRSGFGQNQTSGYVILLRDITREKSLEEERDEFISVVSHELRTPIAIAEGNISNAKFLYKKSDINNPTISEALDQAHDQINFLSGLINDLSTLSRAERGVLKPEVDSINVVQLISELQQAYEPEAHSKGLELKTYVNDELELLRSSKLYLKEILQNFITNAIKYTENGNITLGAEPSDNGVRFYVSDTGIGIAKSDKEKVFDKFFRSDNSKTRAASGTGLGLYVTMKLAKIIGAQISLESELGNGSTFTIFIPDQQHK